MISVPVHIDGFGVTARRQAGLNKLEFSLVVAVASVAAAIFLAKVIEVQELGERTMVEATLRNIQTGLRWTVSEAMMRGEEDRVAELPGSNPVRWMERPPKGYLGEFEGAPASVAAGSWYFDRRGRELAYRPRLSRHLVIEDGGGELRWRIAPGQGTERTALRGGALPVVTSTKPYRWGGG